METELLDLVQEHEKLLFKLELLVSELIRTHPDKRRMSDALNKVGFKLIPLEHD